jgi:hypothetical protein
MAWKNTVLAKWDQASVGDADTTKIVELPQAMISTIQVRLSGTGGAGTPAVDAMIATSKVKSDKGYIYDARSADMQKIARALTGRIPTITNASGAYTETNQVLFFGRKRRDKSLILDLRSSNVRQLELTFGTLIAATAWATTTVVLTVSIDEWIGAPPAEWQGFISTKEVENKATGTGKCVFDLFKGDKLAGVFINIGTITTIRQVTIGNTSMAMIFGQMNFRDLVNQHNQWFNVDTVETLDALWPLWEDQELFNTALPVLDMADPMVSIERGATTSTARVVQLSLLPK